MKRTEPLKRTLFGRYQGRIKTVLVVAGSYLLCMWFSETFVPHPATLFPAAAIALAALFLEGIELWPVIYLCAFVGSFLAGSSPIFLVIVPAAQTLQAVTGAYLLRKARIDPLFRRSRDIFSLIGVVLCTALIVPSLTWLTEVLQNLFFSTPNFVSAWSFDYVGTVLCLLVLTPFLLRWFSKVYFSRTIPEILETIAVFILLIEIDLLLFTTGVSAVGGLSLTYLLLVPLFWIALRLRPRFVTLALVVTSFFGIFCLFIGPAAPTSAEFSIQLAHTEEFLIVLSMMFLIIVSLEEDRRLSSNLLRSHVATLENAVTRISSESKAKNDFIAILGHELRNPLAPVVTGIEYLKAKGTRDPSEESMLEVMGDRMQTVRRLLDDMLDISRVTEGKMTLKRERIDLDVVIRRALLSTEHLFKEHHQMLVFRSPKEPLHIMGDAVRIEQIVSNLLTNASKYSQSGDQISVSVEERNGNAEIRVSDTGSGISPLLLDKIFTPFEQGEQESQLKKGLGIGLALVRSFAELHGGSVRAQSEGVGKGSLFIVTLPLAPAERPSRVAPLPSVVSRVIPGKQSGPLILVVDDNEAAASGIGRLLELKGCSVLYAYSGRQGIERATSENPDLVLLDIGLPDIDGYTVAKTMRARGFRGTLVALTGYSTEEAREKGKEAGFEHYLVKPIGLAELRKIIPGMG